MPDSYKNPFKLENEWEGNQLGDPFIMRFDGFYYLYCSSHGAEVKCWRSENLVDFTYIGSVCSLPEIEGAYAPEVCYTKGKFYMITSPKGNGHYLLESSSPEGPFELVSENFGLLIDGSLFIDDDGKEYLLRAGHEGIVVHDMPTTDFPEIVGTTIKQSWLNYWTEGPMMIKRNGRYFLTYSGNHLLSRGYRVAYSVSETSPKEGFVNLRNQILLLEVGDDFHALGHSSSVLGPDMDSYYIAYHSFDFRTDQPFRSLNIDRLFFNEARMYTNATWWEQAAPKMPEFTSRNGDKLVKVQLSGRQFYVTPVVKGMFTAEFNINPHNGAIAVAAGIGSEAPLILEIAGTGEYGLYKNCNVFENEVKESQVVLAGALPDNVCLHANLTVRLSYTNKKMIRIWFNGMFAGEARADLMDGALGIWSECGCTPGFVGYSYTADGSGDLSALKSVPGRFDAVHCLNGTFQKENFHECGMNIGGIRCNKGTTLSYNLNVKEKAEYSVFVRAKDIKDEIELITNVGRLSGKTCGVADCDGFEIVRVGTVLLDKGIQTFDIEYVTEGVLLDYFEIVPFKEAKNISIVENGRNVYPPLQIMGHKGSQSMIHKYNGFTCAENHGMAFAGETGWTDYSIHAVLNIDPRVNGNLSIFVRASRESWFHAQAAESFFGYRIKADAGGVTLSRCRYNETQLAQLRLAYEGACKLTFDITVQGAEINILINGRQKLTYIDPEQFGYGKVGMESMWEGCGFEVFEVKRL